MGQKAQSVTTDSSIA